MTFQPGANLYTAGFGTRPENVEVPHIEVRDPSSTDVNYPIGKRWINTSNQQEFILYKFQSVNGVTQSIWGTPSGVVGPVLSLSNGTTTVLPDTNGNIQILGTSAQITASSNPVFNSLSLSFPNSVVFPGAVSGPGPWSIASTGGENIIIGNNSIPTQDLSIQCNTLSVGAFATFSNGSDFTGNLALNDSTTVITDNAFCLETSVIFEGPVTYNASGAETMFKCLTAAGAITINLSATTNPGSIMIFYDSDGNSAVNNITINAPPGFSFRRGGAAPSAVVVIDSQYENLLCICDTQTANILILNQ